MVESITSHSQQGLRDWLLQRLTAIVTAVYLVVLLYFVCRHQPLSFEVWQAWCMQTWVQVLSSLAIASILLHARIGLWIVLTDYVKPYAMRILLQGFVMLALLGCFIWGLEIIWRGG